MTNTEYRDIKLTIFEKVESGEITVEQKQALLAHLEATKEEENLSKDDVKDFFKKLVEQFPELEDDAEKFQDKIEKAAKGDEKSSKKEDDEDDKEEDEEEGEEEAEEPEEEVSEAAIELMRRIKGI